LLASGSSCSVFGPGRDIRVLCRVRASLSTSVN